MKNSEVMQKLLDLTEENARLKSALKILKLLKQKTETEDRSYVFDRHEVDMILSVAGMDDKEITAIYFDNCKEKAYEP